MVIFWMPPQGTIQVINGVASTLLQTLVKERMRWRLGNGHSINIWSQPWLRKTNKSYVSYLPSLGLESLHVNFIINCDCGCWNLDVAEQIFNEEDFKDLQIMSLTNIQDNDIPIQKFSSTEVYTVKSTYHPLMERMICNKHLKVQGNWNMLWNLQLPPKIKPFLWRSLRCYLPMRTRLQTKGVHYSSQCEYCKTNLNECHIFFDCQQVKSVWEATGLWYQVSQHMGIVESASEFDIYSSRETSYGA